MELSYYDGIWAYGCIIVAFLIVTLAQVILRVVYARYKKVDSKNGMTGKEIAEGREFVGIIRGLSPIGSLLIEDIKANSIKEFAFKEISYIL